MTYSKMTSMKDLVKNMSVGNHQEKEIVVDTFAKNVINKVFSELSLIFPAWKHNWKDEAQLNSVKLQWTKAFVENNISTLDQIKCGFAKARKSESDFLPSCGKFISWCTPSPEDLGYPSEQQAMNECIQHRNKSKLFDSTARPFIAELCKRVDWWLVTTACTQVEHKKAEKHFSEIYLNLVNSGYQEPEEATSERLETSEVVSERMSPQQKEDARERGKDCVKEIKRKLAQKKLNKGE